MTEESAPLIRRSRRKVSYTSISNSIIDHPLLSAEARLALIYLLSKPDDWQVQIGDLRRMLGVGDRRCGRDKVYAVLNELKATGYIAVKTELQNGRFQRTVYHVFDDPISAPGESAGQLEELSMQPGSRTECLATPMALPTNASVAVSSLPEKPDTEKPDPENPHVTKNRKIQNTEIPRPPPAERARRWRGGSKDGEADGFSDLWDQWPDAERPRSRLAADRCFRTLSPGDRLLASQHAERHRLVQRARSQTPLMIPYLRNRQFAEYVGAPPMDGPYFVITPDRREWSAWMSDCRKKCSETIVAAQEAKGILLTKTRWPGR